MVNKCSVVGCFTNYDGHDKGTVFGLPKDVDIKHCWIKFLNRENFSECLSYIFICEKHFDDKYLNKINGKRTRLINKLKPVPSIYPTCYDDLPSLQSAISLPRKSPTPRPFLLDQTESFIKKYDIDDFKDVNSSLLTHLEDGYEFKKYEDHVVFYKLNTDELSIPEVTECIRIDKNLHVRLFYKRSPLPLPQWFRYGRDCRLTNKTMLENFPSYIGRENENFSPIFEELQQIKFKKKPIYSANIIRYALMLRYSSLQAYKIILEEFNLPSVSLLRKISKGKIDALKSVNILRENGPIDKNVILMFDEMYLQKEEDYVGGELVGANEEGELYKGIVAFMIVGLKQSIPYVIKVLPVTKINGDWLKCELLNCLHALHKNGFNVRGVVCDDHSSNVSAYKKLLSDCGQNEDDLFVMLCGKKTYLFHDAVHLMKNIRNNLINNKRFLFPSFNFDGFFDEINVTGGEISWKLLHEVHEKDDKLDANLRKAPRITSKVLHPGSCKQSVPVALAVFHETTSAAIYSYFPDRTDAAQFLKLFNDWWIISNSKNQYNFNNNLGNAAIHGDGKPEFLRAMANWIQKWENEKIPNCEKFGLSKQTSAALQRTLHCHAALIEDLLTIDGYKFVLTSRFQSDPLERRYGQYRQMSGGRFLVSLKEVLSSENIIKIKSLMKEGFDIDDNLKVSTDQHLNLETLEKNIEPVISDANSISLNEESREVAVYIAGYVAHKVIRYCEGCCEGLLLFGEESVESKYLHLLSRGGLKVPSESLSNYVCHGFAILDASSQIIKKLPCSCSRSS